MVFVNHDSMCYEQDMIGVLTGQFLADDRSSHPIYEKFSKGRIKNEKYLIHLFQCTALCALFTCDPTTIKSIAKVLPRCPPKKMSTEHEILKWYI